VDTEIPIINPTPPWLTEVLHALVVKRDALQAQCDEREKVAEAARRACVPVQQQLAKLKDAIQALEHMESWAAGTAWEVPF